MPAAVTANKALAASANQDKALIRSLKTRAPWPLVRRFLTEQELRPGVGWPFVEQQLANGKAGSAELRDALHELYSRLRLTGKRYIQCFQLPPDAFPAIAATLDSAVIPSSVFSTAFPFSLALSDLDNSPTSPTLCGVEKSSEGDYYLTFCSRRDFSDREIFEDSAARSMASKVPALEGSDKIIVLRRRSIQAFDVIAIRSRIQRVEVMIDLPISHANDFDRHEQALRIRFEAASTVPALGGIKELTGAVNFFNAIDALYRSPRGGQIQEIKFRTSTGLIDFLRATVDSVDLRSDLYHSTGAKAINNEIELFELVTRIDTTRPSCVVLVKLASTVRTLSGPPESRWLHGLELVECASPEAGVLAVNKVLSFSS